MSEYGELDHYFMQLLTGHCCFRAYSHWFRLVDDASCPTCKLSHEDVENVFFHWQLFASERKSLQILNCKQLFPDTITGMLISETMWNALVDYAVRVIREFRRAEKTRRGGVT